MKINWKVRFKNPVFWIGLAGAVMTPILAYSGMSYADLTSWGSIRDLALEVANNPFLIGTIISSVLSAIGVIADTTTKGICDSKQAMTYDVPKED